MTESPSGLSLQDRRCFANRKKENHRILWFQKSLRDHLQLGEMVHREVKQSATCHIAETTRRVYIKQPSTQSVFNNYYPLVSFQLPRKSSDCFMWYFPGR